MNHQVWTRLYNENNPLEKKCFYDWLYSQRHLNRFNPQLFEKGQIKVLTCFNNTGIVGFVPLTLAFFMNYVAWRPGLDDGSKAEMLKSVQHYIVGKADEKMVPDAFFYPSDEHYAKFARRYGWRDVTDPLLNLHFADLEGLNERS